ncbi:MAG: glycosyltransferase [Candidatus Uhrbacteria bacterium]|nr:glycosyltransferase [Candidatus Uhrbacteria bacterium]MDP3793371.1 glycosyltransferase [Candidatus Uhrbacteria bacterium]
MRLSIVIPVKNEERLLPNLLESIRQQSLREDVEVIVADAGSTDATQEIAVSFGAKIVEGGLPGVGRNRGALKAQGQDIFFFDADIILPHPTFLQDCLREKEERGLDVASCQVLALDGSTLDRLLHHAYNLYTLATEKVLPHAAGFCLLTSRAAHAAIHGFDERVVFAEDHDYARRAKKAGFKVGILHTHKVPVSVRRLQKDGRLNLAVKYIFTEMYMLTRGSLKAETPMGQKYLTNWERVGDAMREEENRES